MSLIGPAGVFELLHPESERVNLASPRAPFGTRNAALDPYPIPLLAGSRDGCQHLRAVARSRAISQIGNVGAVVCVLVSFARLPSIR